MMPPMATARAALLTLENVEVAYHRVITAVQGVSLEVARGAIVALLGTNGAGKTSILNCICGIYRPSRGRVLLGDADITRAAPHA